MPTTEEAQQDHQSCAQKAGGIVSCSVGLRLSCDMVQGRPRPRQREGFGRGGMAAPAIEGDLEPASLAVLLPKSRPKQLSTEGGLGAWHAFQSVALGMGGPAGEGASSAVAVEWRSS